MNSTNINAEKILSHLDEAARIILSTKAMVDEIEKSAELISAAIQKGKKVMWCGNGGSAADSQHLAAELIGRYKLTRPGIASLALTTDTSVITAISNDFGFDHVFERQLQALGHSGDVLVALTTSGKSKSILNALDQARKMDIKTILLSSTQAESIKADLKLLVNSNQTEQIQHAHIALGHVICELVEFILFG